MVEFRRVCLFRRNSAIGHKTRTSSQTPDYGCQPGAQPRAARVWGQAANPLSRQPMVEFRRVCAYFAGIQPLDIRLGPALRPQTWVSDKELSQGPQGSGGKLVTPSPGSQSLNFGVCAYFRRSSAIGHKTRASSRPQRACRTTNICPSS